MNYTIIIDYQKDFIDGSLYNKDAIDIRKNLISRLKSDINKKNKIIFTMDTHDANTYLNTNEGKHLPVIHCVKNTLGWQLDKEMIDSIDTDYQIIEKNSFGFKDWKLENPLNIYLAGVCTDICVVSNALILKALYPEANIYVYSDACAGLTKEKHDAALETMRSCQIEVI